MVANDLNIVPGADHLIMISPDDPHGPGILGELLRHVEVDVLVHGPGHNTREAGGHPGHGQRQQLIKCGVQNLKRTVIRLNVTKAKYFRLRLTLREGRDAERQHNQTMTNRKDKTDKDCHFFKLLTDSKKHTFLPVLISPDSSWPASWRGSPLLTSPSL